MPTRSYYCGEGGTVRRLDNLTGSWLVKDVPNQTVDLNDIMASPTNPDFVFTVGSNNAIFRSVDAGDTWTTPGGGYLAFPSTIWYEVWIIDNNNIVVCGSEGKVAISNDGGLTFGIPSNLPTTTGFQMPGKAARAIHFISPTTGVVGFEDRVYKTTDGGNTWTLGTPVTMSPLIPGSSRPPVINGIHLDQSGQIIVVHGDTNIWRSVDGGLTFVPVYSYLHTIFSHPSNIFIHNGRHLTWYDDNNLWGTGDYGEMVRSTNGGATWTLIRTGFTLPSPTPTINRAAHFYKLVSGTADGFWNKDDILNKTLDSGVTGLYSDTSPVVINAVWTSYLNPQCYQLIKCGEQNPVPIIVNDDLSGYVGFIVSINNQCFEVQLSSTCQGSVTLFPNGVPQLPTFPTCPHCDPPDCYQLTDCTGQTPVIITSSDLSQYNNQVIKLCNFNSSPVIGLNKTNLSCSVPGSAGTVLTVTGPTTGTYYDHATDTVRPYQNPSLFPLVVGSSACFDTSSPHTVLAVSSSTVYTLQIFVGSTPITNPIHFTADITVNGLQHIVNQNVIYPGAIVTVNYFLLGLNFNVQITSPTTETEVKVTFSPSISGQSEVTEVLTGSCICYTVENIGPCQFEQFPPPPLDLPISGCFPDCECCIGPPPKDPDPPYIPTPPEINKETFFIHESQCDIDTNKLYASAIYSIFKQRQYGMESCCNINYLKVWIRKQLSDLSKIKC